MATLMAFMLAAFTANAGSPDAASRLHCDDVDQCSSSNQTGLELLQRHSRKVAAAKRKPWWESPAATVLPAAWLHVPKCGSSFINALIHIPGACYGLPKDLEITDLTMGPDNLAGFWTKYPSFVNCPWAFRSFGGHVGVGGQKSYEAKWKGHGLVMLREPAQRLLSAWHDNRHSWPASPTNPPPNDLGVYANQVQGCAVRMLTRPGTSHSVEVQHNYGAVGPHWGGPCGGEGLVPLTWAEVGVAKRRLREGFVFVGLDEEWELSMCLFHATVGGHCHAAEFVDSRHQIKPKHAYDESALAILNFTDPYDGALYKEAKSIFWERFIAYNLSIEACQPCFARAGVTFP